MSATHFHLEKDSHHDVIIIGGGPAGSTAAITLAQKGLSVLLLERSRFPRFHIGESMLPYTTRLLEQLGILGVIESQNFVLKWGAEFAGVRGDSKRVDFTDLGSGYIHYTFQVERACFDNALLACAKEAGVHVLEEASVIRPLLEQGRVVGVEYEYRGQKQTEYASYVIDASGRAGVIANFFKLRKPIPRQRMVAVFKHFGNYSEYNHPGYAGDIQVGNHEQGWVWAIPIRKDTISIGTVTRAEFIKASSPEEIFERHIRRIPRIQQRMAGTTHLGRVKTESDYCYYVDTAVGPGYFLVGDTGCFVDPIFSGGVYLAMTTGRRAAESIAAILSRDLSYEDAAQHYENFYKTGYDCYFRVMYAFYESNFNFAEEIANMSPDYVPSQDKPEPLLAGIPFNRARYGVKFSRKWLARLLSGDLWSMHNPLTRFLRSVSAWDTFAPFEPTFGCPVYPENDLPVRGD